ncbi:MAG: class I SAM-dependent methyltransferase [Candidatus Diapherotrites archaeon]|nr:class I SAM-dependent methyltransferase [Candidatus Diapherotrites archaeon]
MNKKFESIYQKPESAPWTFKKIPKEIKELVQKGILRKGIRVLEVGCGEGHHSIFLARHGLNILAIDSSRKAIEFAKENVSKENIPVEFSQPDYHEIHKLKEKFDFIFDWRFLHEITNENDRIKYLEEISQHLKPNGMYLSVSFSGDSEFMGKRKLRVAPAGFEIYFSTLLNLENLFSKNFESIESKHILVPQKPNLKIKANYILCRPRL